MVGCEGAEGDLHAIYPLKCCKRRLHDLPQPRETRLVGVQHDDRGCVSPGAQYALDLAPHLSPRLRRPADQGQSLKETAARRDAVDNLHQAFGFRAPGEPAPHRGRRNPDRRGGPRVDQQQEPVDAAAQASHPFGRRPPGGETDADPVPDQPRQAAAVACGTDQDTVFRDFFYGQTGAPPGGFFDPQHHPARRTRPANRKRQFQQGRLERRAHDRIREGQPKLERKAPARGARPTGQSSLTRGSAAGTR